MSTPNPLQPQTVKFEDNRDVYASECLVTDDVLLKIKRSKNMVARSPLLLDVHGGVRAKIQTKILSKVKSAKDNINKLIKTTGRVSPAISNFDPHVHPSPSLTPASQRSISRVCNVTVSHVLPSGKARLEAATSLIAYSEYTVEEYNIDDFISISRCVAKTPSPSLPMQLLTVPDSQRAPPSVFLLDKLSTTEKEVGDPQPAPRSVHTEPETLTTSSLHSPLATSDSEAKYDSMLAAEFATFSFNSKDIQEWSDEVEKQKQAEMDAHFAYASEALAVAIPKLSAYFATDSCVGDESISDPSSPVKTEISEADTSLADSSLITSVDGEDDRPQLSPMVLCGLRKVRNYRDLKAMTNRNDSFSDLSCWSLNLDPLDLAAGGSKVGALRRSMKCSDLRVRYM